MRYPSAMNATVPLTNRPEKLRLRSEDFLLLNDNGAFQDYGKTELIDGEIYYVNSRHLGHARAKSRLTIELALALREMKSELEAISEVGVRASDHSVPEADIVLTTQRDGGVVAADTVALAVEVADTTLNIDLGRKARLYAAAGVPEYWVIDMQVGRIVVQAEPEGDRYTRRTEVRFGDPLYAVTIEGLVLRQLRLED